MFRAALAHVFTLALGFGCLPASGQSYPSRPVTIVIPQQAGSNSDQVIRPLLPQLQQAVGGPGIVIDNRAGANGIIGSEFVARSRPDGYTLLLASSSVFVTNANLYKKLSYDPVKDFRPIAGLAKTSMMFVARADFVPENIDQLLTAARQGPPLAIAYGSSTAQVAIALLASVSNTKFNPLPYKGSPQLLTDLLGGTVQVGVVDIASGAPYVKSGKLKALAITDSSRSDFVPGVPTLAEKFPGVSLVSWVGLVAPAGTPDAVVHVWQEAAKTVAQKPETAQRYMAASLTPALLSASELDSTIREDMVKWGALMRAAGIEKE